MRDTERERQRHRQREEQAPCREPDVGLDPGTPGSHPGPKAGAKPLSHPGIPEFAFLICYAANICFQFMLWSLYMVFFFYRYLFFTCYYGKIKHSKSREKSIPRTHFLKKILFIYSWETHTEREREREAETQAEGEAGPMQGARRGTRSRVSRITPWAEGGAKPLSHPGCPPKLFWSWFQTSSHFIHKYFSMYL